MHKFLIIELAIAVLHLTKSRQNCPICQDKNAQFQTNSNTFPNQLTQDNFKCCGEYCNCYNSTCGCTTSLQWKWLQSTYMYVHAIPQLLNLLCVKSVLLSCTNAAMLTSSLGRKGMGLQISVIRIRLYRYGRTFCYNSMCMFAYIHMYICMYVCTRTLIGAKCKTSKKNLATSSAD